MCSASVRHVNHDAWRLAPYTQVMTDEYRRPGYLGPLLGVVITFAGALAFAEFTYSGFGESGPDEMVAWLLFFAAWVGVTAASSICALVLKSNPMIAMAIAAVTWPFVIFAAYVLVFVTSCTGLGSHACMFS